MRVCLLSLEELGRLNNYDIMPRCSEHRHLSLQEAVDGIKADTYIAVGEDKDINAVVEQWSNNRRWAGRESAGYQVLQLVRVGQ